MALSSRDKRLALIAIVVAGVLIYFGSSAARRERLAARLPVLPDLSAQRPAVRAHLTAADFTARARPDSADAVGTLGLAYHADMFFDQAARAYAAARRLNASEWQWTYYAALVEETRGNAEATVAALRQVVDKAPNFGEAWWRLGEAEFKTGHYDAAEKDFRRAVSLPESSPAARADSPSRVAAAPTSAYAAVGLARIAMLRNDSNDARTILEDVIHESPGFGPAHRLLGAVYSIEGREADRLRSIRMADRLPGYDPYVGSMIDALVRESRNPTFLLQQAASADININAAWREHLIRRALEFDPDNADALYELASLLRVLRRFDEALPLLERHQRAAPGDFQTLADIGRCLSGLQRFTEAESVLRKAVAGLDDANTRYDLGLVLDRTGRMPDAIAEYERALERNPNHHDALNNLGVALARQGKTRGAAARFERLVTIDPDNADGHTNFAAILLAVGDRDGAAREFRAALEIDPEHVRAREGLGRLR